MAINEEGWKIGTLPLDEFSFIENALQSMNVLAPIVTAEIVPIDTTFNEHTLIAIELYKQVLSINPDISFCFVASDRVNAFASRSTKSQKYYIALFVGIILAVETLEKLLLNNSTRRLLRLKPLTANEIDPAHIANLGQLAGIALRWLIFHELGHITNGHLHLPLGGFGSAAEEHVSSSRTEDDNLTLHTLEFDADAFAAKFMTVELLTSPVSPEVTILQTPIAKMRALALCIHTMMRSFEPQNRSTRNLLSYSHPPAFLRITQMNFFGGSMFEGLPHYGITADLWLQESSECIAVVEREFLIRENAGLRANDRRFLSDGRWERYIQRISKRWDALRPKLEPFVLGGTLLPASKESA